MKKYIFTLLLLFVCHLGFGQSIDGLFQEFGNEKNAEYVKASPFLMFIGKMFVGHDEGGEIANKVKSAQVLDLEDCHSDVKKRFEQKVKHLNTQGYEELVRMNDEGGRIRILVKIKKKTIREFLFVCTGNNDCTLMQVKGRFTKDDIDQLVNEETGKKHGRR